VNCKTPVESCQSREELLNSTLMNTQTEGTKANRTVRVSSGQMAPDVLAEEGKHPLGGVCQEVGSDWGDVSCEATPQPSQERPE